MESITAICTRGLVKKANEDVLCIRSVDSNTIACLCDGHWGRQAARLACDTLSQSFPYSRRQAVKTLQSIQHSLYFARKRSKPPETSVLGIRISRLTHQITLVSYGDCRLLISRNNKIVYSMPVKSTWLGALSYEKERGRLSVEKACLFTKTRLNPGDIIYMFTDGIDECVYETPTIPHSWIARHSPVAIMRRVYRHGAEDNASLIVIKC